MTTTETSQNGRRPLFTGAGLSALIALAALLLATSTALASGAPGAPVGLVVAPGNGTLVAGWSPPQGDTAVDSYTVQFKGGSDFDWTTASYRGTGTDTEISGLTNGASYQVRVQASNSDGDGPWSAPAGATPHEDIVWAAIMTVTVDVDGNTYGCVDSSISTADIAECRTALTDDDFTFDGGSYRWTSLYEVTDPWHHAVMGFNASVPSNSGLRTGTMQVGAKSIYLGQTDQTRFRWLDDGDGWVVPRPANERSAPGFFPAQGQRLALSLKARIPSDGDGSGSNDGDSENSQPGDNGQGPGSDGPGQDDGSGPDPSNQAQRALFQECRDYTRGLEGLRVCKLPFEGRDAVLMLTLDSPAPAGGTTVYLATDERLQGASSDDFTMPSTITIVEGEVSGLIVINIAADGEDEDHESILIYACITDGCDPLNPTPGEKAYNHGLTIPGTRVGGV